MDAEVRVYERKQAAGDDPDQEAELPGACDVGPPEPEERAHQHVPLETDVHDAASLGEHPADRGERQRRGIPQRGPDER